MTEAKWHFEKGVWVEDTGPRAGAPEGNAIDKRLTEATKSVIASIDDVMNVTYDLVTTEEGKQYIRKTITDTQTQVQKSLDEILKRVKDEMEKKTKAGK